MTSSHPDIGVGIVGLGTAARTFHLPLIAATPGLRLVAAATSRPREARLLVPGVRLHATAAELYEDPAVSVVVIATPPDRHTALAVAALEAGKHVVVEKPFTLESTDARQIARVAQRANRLVTVFQNRRHDSCFLTVRREIARGTIGRVTHFESHFDRYRPVVRVRWKEAAGTAGGVWSDLGPHLVDQTLVLFGKPESVTAILAQHRDDAMTDDWAHVVLHYPGMEAVLHASMLVASGAPRFTVHGTDGSLQKRRADPQEQQLQEGLRPGDALFGVDPDELQWWDADGVARSAAAERGDQAAFYRQLQLALTLDEPSPVTIAQAIATVDVMDAVRRSARERRTILL